MYKFKNHLQNIDWFPVHNAVGVDNKFIVFSRIVAEPHDVYFPLTIVRNINPGKQSKPWITSGILNSIEKKNNMYNHYIKSQSPKIKEKYVKYKNKLVSVLRAAEKDYYAIRLSKVKDNISKTWKLLNEMTNRNAKPKPITQVKVDGKLIDDPHQISQQFNNFFVNIGPDLANKIPASCKKPVDYLVSSYPNSMFLAPTNEYEYVDVIANLKNTQSKGHDTLPLKLIKECSSELAPTLAYLNNQSFSEGVVPDQLKIAKVIPIHKNDDPNLVQNYRPISVLTHFSKISEKLVCSRLNKYIADNAILHSN